MSEKLTWIISPNLNWEDKKEFITTSLESGIDYVLDLNDMDNIHKIGSINVISNDENADIYLIGIDGEGDNSYSLPDDLSISKDLLEAKKAKENNKTTCAYIEITDKKHEQLAVSLGKVVDYIILYGKDWTVIPFENIIADLQNEDVKIIAYVENINQAKLAIETLEVGTDGIIFKANDINQIKEMSKFMASQSSEKFTLKDATISNIKPLGSGDRVCVDTTSIMSPGEGMLIGSYSKAMFLVHSESIDSEYVASRPFRVNAGPVQAYIMVPGNKTRYLSELKAGDEILIVNDKGESRKSYVGRCKIEKRPLILVEAKYEDITIRTLLQNAETIRLVDNNYNPISISNLKINDKIKVYIDKGARHFGISIKENIIER